MTAEELHVHVHVTVDGANTAELKEILMTTKDELLANVASLRELVVETNSDIQRVIEKLDAAIAAGDLTEVAAGVEDLRTLVQAGDDALEAADPEVVEPPTGPEVP